MSKSFEDQIREANLAKLRNMIGGFQDDKRLATQDVLQKGGRKAVIGGTPYHISKIKNCAAEDLTPRGCEYFQLHPVDYNGDGIDEVGVAFLTEEGKQKYASLITGSR